MSKAWAAVAINSLAGKLENSPEKSYTEFCQRLGITNPEFPEKSALFVTWDKRELLRGCIGTFQPLPTEEGVRKYALTAALHDSRFKPIKASELPQLEASVTLLGPLERCADPFDWELGKHGIQANFRGGRSATFLPDIPIEFGWDQQETFLHLADKAGVYVPGKDYMDGLKVWRYEGRKASLSYEEYTKLV